MSKNNKSKALQGIALILSICYLYAICVRSYHYSLPVQIDKLPEIPKQECEIIYYKKNQSSVVMQHQDKLIYNSQEKKGKVLNDAKVIARNSKANEVLNTIRKRYQQGK